jgi:hypothetical protein
MIAVMPNRGAKERRWIVLADDGRHVTLGRDSDPNPDEIDRAGDTLKALGHGGWLAVLEGSYYSRDGVSLMQVRAIGAEAAASWEVAVEAFKAARQQATAPSRTSAPRLG